MIASSSMFCTGWESRKSTISSMMCILFFTLMALWSLPSSRRGQSSVWNNTDFLRGLIKCCRWSKSNLSRWRGRGAPFQTLGLGGQQSVCSARYVSAEEAGCGSCCPLGSGLWQNSGLYLGHAVRRRSLALWIHLWYTVEHTKSILIIYVPALDNNKNF